jgi:hypothetical protein
MVYCVHLDLTLLKCMQTMSGAQISLPEMGGMSSGLCGPALASISTLMCSVSFLTVDNGIGIDAWRRGCGAGLFIIVFAGIFIAAVVGGVERHLHFKALAAEEGGEEDEEGKVDEAMAVAGRRIHATLAGHIMHLLSMCICSPSSLSKHVCVQASCATYTNTGAFLPQPPGPRAIDAPAAHVAKNAFQWW